MNEIKQKMALLEQALVQQRKNGMQLESQLSAAQDRIGGAERRAKTLEEENSRIQGEIKYWNDLYSQETGEVPPSVANSPPLNVAANVAISAPVLYMPVAVGPSCGTQILLLQSLVKKRCVLRSAARSRQTATRSFANPGSLYTLHPDA